MIIMMIMKMMMMMMMIRRRRLEFIEFLFLNDLMFNLFLYIINSLHTEVIN